MLLPGSVAILMLVVYKRDGSNNSHSPLGYDGNARPKLHQIYMECIYGHVQKLSSMYHLHISGSANTCLSVRFVVSTLFV